MGEEWCRDVLGKRRKRSVGEEGCREVLGKSGVEGNSGVERCWGRVV